jgi:hypothetical protein
MHGAQPTPITPAPVDDATEADLAAHLPGTWIAVKEQAADGSWTEVTAKLQYTFGRGDMQLTFGDGSMTLCQTERQGRNLTANCNTPGVFRGEIQTRYQYRIERVDQQQLVLFDYPSSSVMHLARQ